MNWFKRWRWERKMDTEFRFHLESQVDDYVRQGMTRADAELRARREFGAVELAKDECRDQKPLEWLEQVFKDVKYAVRSMRRAPGFTATAIATLALGIGANTAVFSLVHGVLLRALPYPQPQRLVSVVRRMSLSDVNIPEYEFSKEHAAALEAVATHRGGGERVLVSGDEREAIRTRLVSTDFFRTLGVAPALGREFTAQETRRGGPLSVILSDQISHRVFGESSDVIGRIVKLGDFDCTVVGVLRRGFWFTEPADAYLPLRPMGTLQDEGANFEMIARLQPGVSLSQAQAGLDVLTESYRREHPRAENYSGLKAIPYQEWLTGDARLKLLLLFGAVGVLLLIACANLAGLLLVRLAARQREIAVRRALGSTSGRLLRQFLIENLLLAGAGSLAGLVGAYWVLDGFVALIPFGLPASGPIRLDWPVLAFTVALSLLVSTAFSVAPILSSARLDVYETLKSGGRSAGSSERQRGRSLLVVSQVGLSAALLVAAALLIQSLYRLHQEPLGFTPHGVMTFWTPPAQERRGKPIELRNFEAAVEEKLRGMPGARLVGGVNVLPLTDQNNFPAQHEGHPEHSIGPMEIRIVTPGYFEAMGIPIRRGRPLTARDTASAAPVILVNEAVASQWWPNGGAIGDRVLLGTYKDQVYGDMKDVPREVVGVVANTKSVYLKAKPRPTVYVSVAQATWYAEDLAWVVRGDLTPGFAQQARRAIAELDSHQRVDRFRSMDEIVASTTVDTRFDAWLFGSFAALALVLTAVGVYGLLSFSVVRRTNEIGMRIALGAGRGDVVAMVLRQGVVLIAVGLVAGLACAYFMTRYLTNLLFGVQPTDPLSFAAVAALLLCVGVLASYLPARRASKVDPMVALRCD
jgi:putative ABC transport system permease protein